QRKQFLLRDGAGLFDTVPVHGVLIASQDVSNAWADVLYCQFVHKSRLGVGGDVIVCDLEIHRQLRLHRDGIEILPATLYDRLQSPEPVFLDQTVTPTELT